MTDRPDQAVTWYRISPLSVVFFITSVGRKILGQGLPALIFVVAGLSSMDVVQRDWIFRGLILLVAVSVGFGFLSYLRFRYRVTADRVLLRRGVLHREELEIEFDRVQNVTIKEPFYMRPFGLAVLGIDTAGSNAREIQLAGIKLPLARELRDTIVGSRNAEAATADDSVEPSEEFARTGLLLELTRKDVIIYGLTANFMLWAALALGAFFGSGDVAENSIGWLVSRFQLEEVLAWLHSNGGYLLAGAAIAGLVFLVLLLLPLISVVGAIFRYDGYRLVVEGETYRKSSGLMTRHDDSIKRHKIQALVVKQNAIARFFKRINMQLRQASAGSGLEQGQLPTGANTAFMVPALKPEQAESLSNEFFPGCTPAEIQYSKVDRRRFTVMRLLMILVPATLISIAPSIVVSTKFALVGPLAGLLAFLVINRCWKKLGYAVAGDYGFVRGGFIGSYNNIFPLFKVQRVDIRQTPLQHRRGLAHLTVHLASHSVSVPYISLEDAQLFRDLALWHAESSGRAWF